MPRTRPDTICPRVFSSGKRDTQVTKLLNIMSAKSTVPDAGRGDVTSRDGLPEHHTRFFHAFRLPWYLTYLSVRISVIPIPGQEKPHAAPKNVPAESYCVSGPTSSEKRPTLPAVQLPPKAKTRLGVNIGSPTSPSKGRAWRQRERERERWRETAAATEGDLGEKAAI
jgi:hypothetical protein